MARKKLKPVTREDARTIGFLLRGLRRAAGYRAVRDAAAATGFPTARETTYAYERGGLTPSRAYHVRRAHELIERLQPPLGPNRSQASRR